MSSSNLTAKHRPQTFAQLAGQESIKAILSRAAAEDRIAPAYLFSGTRGVGKTTVARILAKALNCKHAPVAEPCNECVNCRQVTRGNFVDVVEIDAASHGGVDDARSLKEDVGYAPLEGRYKVFIIDEAHMLSRAAFNALLKTLEEPPRGVTFILATTEPHKFPATIISRCQHYVFKRLSQAGLEAHLTDVLVREGIESEPAAVALVARRGQGSVRDSMSLLGQVLALGRGRLLAEDVRQVLGLAGPEVMFAVMEAMAESNPTAIHEVLRDLLDGGLDLGFFLRELAGTWRALFLLRQGGEAALPLLALPEEEGRRWLEWASRFSLAHVHACWQLTLDGQPRVLRSLEPAMALELLLLNLAFLPELIDLESLPGQGGSAAGRTSAPAGRTTGQGGQGGPSGSGPSRNWEGRPSGSYAAGAGGPSGPTPVEPARPAQSVQAGPAAPYGQPVAPGAVRAAGLGTGPAPISHTGQLGQAGQAVQPAPVGPTLGIPDGPRTWAGFVRFYDRRAKETGILIPGVKRVAATIDGETLIVDCNGQTQYDSLGARDSFKTLRELAAIYFGPAMRLEVRKPGNGPQKNGRELRTELKENPQVQEVLAEFDGQLIHVEPAQDR